MKITQFILCLTLLFMASFSSAQTVKENETPIKFGLFAGLTYGGDKIGELIFEDNSSESIKAGALYTLGLSLSGNVTQDIELQANLGYLADSATASNGDMTFSRVVFDFIPYYRINESVSLGLGITFHTGVKLDSDFTSDVKFDSATGLVASGKYYFDNSNSQLELRLVAQEYKIDSIAGINISPDVGDNNKVSGNHIGVNYHYVF